MAPEPAELTELVARPAQGRVYKQTARAWLADCAPSGRLRLDALARWLQDVAYADVDDAGLADRAVWVLRRTRIRVERFPRFGERVLLETFCSGIGRMWAERRTTIAVDGAAGPSAEAAGLWVHLDPATWRPAAFSEQEIAVYGAAAAGRRVSARLRHAPPAAGAARLRHAPPAAGAGAGAYSWTFRAIDCDVADHVNNTAYWQPLEEELLRNGDEPQRIDVEIEFRNPVQPGEKQVLCASGRRWIVSNEGEVHASLVLVA